jgi:hypothetical protein
MRSHVLLRAAVCRHHIVEITLAALKFDRLRGAPHGDANLKIASYDDRLLRRSE